MRAYRDDLLETGRHKDITVISTSHILRNYAKTRVLQNELELAILYPNASRRATDSYLKDILGFDKATRDEYIDRCGSTGRYIAIKMSVPNLLIHNKGVQFI
jgi:hypothetical protein